MTWDWEEGAESKAEKTDGRRTGGNKDDADMNNSVAITVFSSTLNLPLSCPTNPKQEKSFKTLNQSNES